MVAWDTMRKMLEEAKAAGIAESKGDAIPDATPSLQTGDSNAAPSRQCSSASSWKSNLSGLITVCAQNANVQICDNLEKVDSWTASSLGSNDTTSTSWKRIGSRRGCLWTNAGIETVDSRLLET